MISIIVRSKNEERWISSCLEAVASQTLKDVEVVLVDNKSSDRTVDKALTYGVTLVTIDEYIPGKALNAGIAKAKGDIIVCLSGHCIPVNDTWLENLIAELDDPQVAGIYGRQEPLAFTADSDKRDLLITFGLDRREQIKDSFFHNANSAFRKALWNKFPFDETVAHIEDRIWAHKVQEQGYKIIYQPAASVFHHHGIHHTGSKKRCANTVKVLESIGPEEFNTTENKIDVRGLKIVAIIPVRSEGTQVLSGKPLYQLAIDAAKKITAMCINSSYNK